MDQSDTKMSANYFKNEKKILKALGLSLMENNSKLYKVYSFFVILTTNIGYTFLALGDFFKQDFAVIADDMMEYEIASFVALFKTCTVLWNRRKIMSILRKLEQAPFIPNIQRGTEVELNLVKECITITRTQAVVFWSTVITAYIIAVSYTLSIRIRSNYYGDWQFTYGPFTILNVTYSPNYEICWLYQNISMFSIAFHFATIDLLILAVLIHLSYQFKILQNLFRTIGDNLNDSKTSIHSKQIWLRIHQSMRNAVEYHQNIIKVAEEMEDVFSALLLLTYLSSLGMVCFLLYQASSLPITDLLMIRRIAESIVIFFQILIMCYWGEQVMLESQNVGFAVYDSNFTSYDLDLQKCLLIIIRRSQKPVRLTAGKFASLGLSTYIWIMRTSYSAFTVLRSNVNK